MAQPLPGIASYPAVAPTPIQSPPPSDASGLLIAALVFQALISLFWIDVAVNSFGIVGVSIVTGFALLMLLLAIFAVYLPVQKRQYGMAGPVTLLLAILGFFLGLIIVGILYVLAYVRINAAKNAALRPAIAPPVEVVYVPQAPQPPAMRKCAYCGRDYPVTLAACPSCGAPP